MPLKSIQSALSAFSIDMDKRILFFCLAGFLFVSLFGALSHFFYGWSGQNKVAGIFFAANESTWEHLKLALFPTLLYFLAWAFFMDRANYLFAFFIALVTPVLLIPLLFYGYTAIAGNSVLAADIAIYFFSVAAAFFFTGLVLRAPPLPRACSVLALLGIAILLVCYATFTLFPPQNFLFRDPLTGGYGLPKDPPNR